MQVEVSSKQICWHAVILPRSLALFTCLKHHSYISAIRIDFLFFFFFFLASHQMGTLEGRTVPSE